MTEESSFGPIPVTGAYMAPVSTPTMKGIRVSWDTVEGGRNSVFGTNILFDRILPSKVAPHYFDAAWTEMVNRWTEIASRGPEFMDTAKGIARSLFYTEVGYVPRNYNN